MKRTERKWKSKDQYLRAHWPRLREKGRSHFIWRHLVLPICVPTAIVTTAWFYHLLNLYPSDIASARGLGVIYVVFAIIIASGYRYGSKEWENQEADYLKSNAWRDSPDFHN